MREMDVDTFCGLARDGKHSEVAAALLRDGSLAQKTDQSGRTVLHWAAVGGNVDTVKLIVLNYGVDPDISDEVSWTPLMIASSAGKVDVANVLVDCGASLESRNSTGQCALHYAASKKRLEIVELLLNKGACPNITDKYGSTPLHRAASLGHTSITKLLLGFKADPNMSNSEGNTPLHLACEEGRSADVRALVSAGADMASLNKEEKTPMMIASKDLQNLLQSLQSSRLD